MTTPKISDSPTYQTYLAFATRAATPKTKRIYKKHDSPMIKTTIISLEETPLEKKYAPAKKYVSSKKPSRKQSTGVQIRDTPGVSVSKKKAPAITDKSKGIDLMSGATLLEDAQMKKVLKWSKREIHSPQPSGSDDSDEDSSDNDSDNERTEFDVDENLNLNKNDADIEEEYEEEYVNVKLKDVEHGEEGKGGAEKTDTGHDDVTQETSYDKVEYDAHVTLTAVHDTQKTEVPLQSSYVSSDFATQFLNLDNVPPADTEINSIMNINVPHEEPKFKKKAQAKKKRYINLVEKSVKDIINDVVKTQLPQILPKEVSNFATHVIQSTITELLENVVLAKSSSQPQSTYKAVVSLTEFELKKIILDKMQKSQSYRRAKEHKELYDRQVKSYKLDKDLFESYGKAYSLKRDHEDKDKDEDPPAGSDQGLKRRKTSKDAKPSKSPKSKESKSSSSKGTKSQPKSSSKSTKAEESVFGLLTLICTKSRTFNLLKGTCKSRVELEYNIKECYKDVTDRLDWNNPKGKEYLFDLSKPLLFIMDRGRQVVPVDYFINNDLEHLRGGRSSRKYTTSTTKTKASKYDIQGIKDMVLSLWSPVKVAYDRHVVWGTSHRVLNDNDYMDSQATGRLKFEEKISNCTSSRKVTSHDFTYLQLGIESYHKKLNISKPETFKFDISNRTPYTTYNNPQGIIYEHKYKRNMLMRTDELYKFSDGTLTSVRSVLHDIGLNPRMDYLPKIISCYYFKDGVDFQDSPDDEEDTRSSQEYLNDLEEEYQERALLAKSKRFFKKVPSKHKPELRPTKDFEAKYNKVKAKLALLSSSASASKAFMVKVLMALDEENDVVSKESARNSEWVKISMRKVEEQRSNLLSKQRNLVHELNTCKEQLLVLKQAKLNFLTISKKVNQCISEQIPSQKKKILGVDQLTKDPSTLGQKDLVFVKSSVDDTKVTITGVEIPWLSEAEGFILPNHDTGRILPTKSQRNTTDLLVAFTDSSATDYDSADESSVCSTLLPPLKKLEGVEPISGPKTIKSIVKSKSTLKAEALKGVIINEPSLAPDKGNKSSSASKVHSAPAACGSSSHTTTDHYDIEWFKRGETLHVKKAEALKSTKAESSNANRSKTPTKRHMTGVKSYLHTYVEQPGPKVVFRDDSTCTTKGYGSIKCNGRVFTKVAFVNGLKYNLISISQLCDAKYIVHFDKKRGTIFNSNKEIVMIAPRVRDVYVLDMTSSTQESCFFAKASENLN
ncbi:hypothetical protein Tco_0519762 [Tanacetum coccineum]